LFPFKNKSFHFENVKVAHCKCLKFFPGISGQGLFETDLFLKAVSNLFFNEKNHVKKLLTRH